VLEPDCKCFGKCFSPRGSVFFKAIFQKKNVLKAHLAALVGTFEAARRAYLAVLVALGALRPLKNSLLGRFGGFGSLAFYF
jgi:hypothetical protein